MNWTARPPAVVAAALLVAYGAGLLRRWVAEEFRVVFVPQPRIFVGDSQYQTNMGGMELT